MQPRHEDYAGDRNQARECGKASGVLPHCRSSRRRDIVGHPAVHRHPKEFAEAAEIFGAKPWTRFTRITLPLLKPSLQSALILRTVLAFEVFAVVYALGGRNFPVLAGEAYVWQNDNQNYGVAAAYAVLIMAISLTRMASLCLCESILWALCKRSTRTRSEKLTPVS